MSCFHVHSEFYAMSYGDRCDLMTRGALGEHALPSAEAISQIFYDLQLYDRNRRIFFARIPEMLECLSHRVLKFQNPLSIINYRCSFMDFVRGWWLDPLRTEHIFTSAGTLLPD